MASIGQVIFWSMIILIFIVSGFLILILSIAFSRSQEPPVYSKNPLPVGNIGKNVLLDCSFHLVGTDGKLATDVSIIWTKEELSGLVIHYQHQSIQLLNQNAQFKDRTQFFKDSIASGNASILLQNVRLKDEGVYYCSVSTGIGRGTASVHLRVAAFSSPRFTRVNNTLMAVAQRWFPEPNVTWFDQDGKALNRTDNLFKNSNGIYYVMSLLAGPIQIDVTYSFLIQNSLVRAMSLATVTDEEIMEQTTFIFNAKSSLLPLHLIYSIPLHLCCHSLFF